MGTINKIKTESFKIYDDEEEEYAANKTTKPTKIHKQPLQ